MTKEEIQEAVKEYLVKHMDIWVTLAGVHDEFIRVEIRLDGETIDSDEVRFRYD